MVKKRKQAGEKRVKDENFSSFMQDKARGYSSKRKSSPSRNRSRIIVSATNTNGKIMGGGVVDNKSLYLLLLFLIFSFIFMVIAEGEEGQIGEQEIFSKKGLLLVKPTSNSQWSVVQNTETDFFPVVFNKSAFSVRGGFT